FRKSQYLDFAGSRRTRIRRVRTSECHGSVGGDRYRSDRDGSLWRRDGQMHRFWNQSLRSGQRHAQSWNGDYVDHRRRQQLGPRCRSCRRRSQLWRGRRKLLSNRCGRRVEHRSQLVQLGASTWTVNGNWTNRSSAAGWTAGTSSVTIRDAANGTLTFAALVGATNEFSNLTLDASVTTSVTYTMATNALRMSGTLTIR